eukprot:776533-Pelagomonas_calceolata.AAC.3
MRLRDHAWHYHPAQHHEHRRNAGQRACTDVMQGREHAHYLGGTHMRGMWLRAQSWHRQQTNAEHSIGEHMLVSKAAPKALRPPLVVATNNVEDQGRGQGCWQYLQALVRGLQLSTQKVCLYFKTSN